MKINLRGKNISITDDIKNEAERKYERLDKYFNKDQEIEILISKEGNDYQVEATIFLTNGPILRAQASDQTYPNAIDKTIDALVRQIRKQKTRLKKSRNADSIKFESFDKNFDSQYDIDDSYESDITIAREKTIDLKPMSSEEAIMQMELLDHNFFVYHDQDTMDVRVVYKRHKGDYGLIIPSK